MSAICIRRGGLESDAAGDAQVEGANGREEGEDACECKGARRVRQAGLYLSELGVLGAPQGRGNARSSRIKYATEGP